MGFKEDLDKYLTREPYDDGFSNWCEELIENELPEDFYNLNEDWIKEYDGVSNGWFSILFNIGKSPKESAEIIVRAFKLYKIETK